MKFRCERDQLLEAVQFASRAISNRATLPVLSGLRIDATESGRIRIAASDLELTMETSIEAGVDEPGQVLVPGKLFEEMATNLPSGQVSLAGQSGEVEISSGRGQFRVKSLQVDDYPQLPTDESGKGEFEFTVDAAELAIGLGQVLNSASTDESRQALTGVQWEVESKQLTLASTDSYRLGVKTMAVEGGPAESHKAVLPGRSLKELSRVLQSSKGSVNVIFRDNLAMFLPDAASGRVLGTRLIEGEFPNYRQLLPESYPNVLTVNRKELVEVARRVGLLAQGNLPVKLRLDNELEVSAYTPDVGEGQEVMEAEYQGESFVIAFNTIFLQSGLSALVGEKLVLTAGDGLKPAILRAEGDASYTYLLMPVRLS